MNYSELLQLAKGWSNFKFERIIIWRLPKYSVKNGIVGFFKKGKLIHPKFWHEINLDDYILELCPECEGESIIFAHGITPCNKCGYPMYPCSGCSRPFCNECIYDRITSENGRKANNRKILKKEAAIVYAAL